MNGIEYAAAAMSAARERLDSTAHDLANAGTDGFRGRVVHARMTARGLVTDHVADERQGPLRFTGRPFDLALIGSGAFQVVDRRGRSATTRAGAFERDGAGRLVDANGRALLGGAGVLRVAAGTEVRADGSVVDGGAVVDRIALAPGTTVRQSYVESSNVDGIACMIDVIAAQRAFECAEKVLAAADGLREKAANETGRLK